MILEPVSHVYVRLVAGVDLLGWDELQAACLAVAGVVGGVLGAWMVGLLT